MLHHFTHPLCMHDCPLHACYFHSSFSCAVEDFSWRIFLPTALLTNRIITSSDPSPNLGSYRQGGPPGTTPRKNCYQVETKSSRWGTAEALCLPSCRLWQRRWGCPHRRTPLRAPGGALVLRPHGGTAAKELLQLNVKASTRRAQGSQAKDALLRWSRCPEPPLPTPHGGGVGF